MERADSPPCRSVRAPSPARSESSRAHGLRAFDRRGTSCGSVPYGFAKDEMRGPMIARDCSMQPLVDTTKRSIVKAVTYRVCIVCLDFLAIYVFTRKVEVALGFMIVSNVYTTVGYYAHERIWARVKWGRVAPRASISVAPVAASALPG